MDHATQKIVKRLVWWLVVIAVLMLAAFGMVKLASQPDVAPLSVNAVEPGDWVKGNMNSKVILIEYSDFQCPACRAYYPLLEKLMAEYGKKIAFVYRHFPLKSIHKNTMVAVKAAEAAGKQGKFWEMHNALFEHQTEWGESDAAESLIVGYAEGLKMNMDLFKADLASNELQDKAERAYKNAVSLGLNGTPSFFINGSELPSPRSYEEFANVIQFYLDKK